MSNGWIKLHRVLKENPIYTESKAVHCWIECLLRAAHKKRVVYLKREKKELNPGQFVMGRREFGKTVGMSGSTAWYWLRRFEADRMVDIKKTTKGSIVTVLKWNEYQQVDRTVDNKKTAKKQQKNTNKNVKKEEKGKNDKKKKVEKSENFSPFQKEIIKRFWVYLEKQHPNTYKQFIKQKDKTEKNWWDTLDKLERLDGFTEQEILKAIKNVVDDNFWQEQFRTLCKLRRKDGEGVKYMAKFLDMSSKEDEWNKYMEEE